METNKCGSFLYSLTGDKETDEKLLQPFNYLTQLPGDYINLKLSSAFNHWLDIPKEKLMEIDDIVQILLDAGFLLDDIQDNSVIRKGEPVAHTIYGTANTINAATYASFLAFEKCFKLGHPDATAVCLEQVLEVNRGQGIEIYWRDNFTCPTEDEYTVMAKQKTAVFVLSIRLMQLFSENKQDYTTLMGILGLYMQIWDDYLSLFSKDYMDIKGYCEDISEGKFSFPLIHAIQKYPNDMEVFDIVKLRTTNDNLKKHCVSLLEKFGSHEYTRNKLGALKNEARKEIERLGGNPYLEHFLDFLQSKM